MPVKHKIRKVLPWLVCVFLLVFCLWSLYHVIDQAVTIHYMKIGYEDQEKTLNLLSKLTVDLNQVSHRSEILSLIKKKYPGYMITEEDNGVIYIGEVGLKFDGDKFIGIVFMNKEMEEKE